MGCETWREALSARLDGERSEVSAGALDAHLDQCAECSAFSARLDRLHRATRVAPAVEVPDLTEGILAAAAAAGPGRRLDLALVTLVLRWLLVVVAAVEIGLASPEILGRWHTGGELGTWAVASAVGFLSVALKPRRAGAVLPMLVCATIFTVFVSLRDITDGRTGLPQEWSHLLLVLGALVLTALWRCEREIEEPGPDAVVVSDRGAVPARGRRAA